MRQDHVPMQVLPCAQVVAVQGTCQCEAINGVKAACLMILNYEIVEG
jgi:hypothetical protein